MISQSLVRGSGSYPRNVFLSHLTFYLVELDWGHGQDARGSICFVLFFYADPRLWFVSTQRFTFYLSHLTFKHLLPLTFFLSLFSLFVDITTRRVTCREHTLVCNRAHFGVQIFTLWCAFDHALVSNCPHLGVQFCTLWCACDLDSTCRDHALVCVRPRLGVHATSIARVGCTLVCPCDHT